MPHFVVGGLRPVFDLRQQLLFDPDAPMRDLLAEGWVFVEDGGACTDVPTIVRDLFEPFGCARRSMATRVSG
jgi:hypothetical protein